MICAIYAIDVFTEFVFVAFVAILSVYTEIDRFE